MKYVYLIVIVCIVSACNSQEYTEAVNKCGAFQPVAKDECLVDVAIEFASVKPCSQIRSSGVRIPCIIEVAKSECDTEFCETITEPWQRPNCTQIVELASQCQ